VLNLLRSNQLFTVFVVVFYALLLHFPVFLSGTSYSIEANGLFSSVLSEWLSGNVLINKVLYMLLIIGQALLINHFTNEFKISASYSYFPAGVYVLLTAFLNPNAVLSSALLANTFLIVAAYELYYSYKKNPANGNLFNVGFWIGVAGLFHFSSVLFLLFGVLGIISLRQVRINELLIAVLGYLVPFFLVFTVYFWKDQLPFLWNAQVGSLSVFDFSQLEFYKELGRIIILGILLVFSFLSFQAYLSKKVIKIQKYVNLIFLFQIIAISTILIQRGLQLDDGLFIVLPLSIFMGMSFFNMKRKAIAEVLFLTLFLLAIWFNYSDFLIQ